MITVEEAKKILIDNTFRLNRIRLRKVKKSLNYFSAEEIYSNLDLPPFNQSNVDGYAVKISGTKNWHVTDEIKAGDNSKRKLKNGEAIRIFTGAIVPEGTDCVIMQEVVSVNMNKTISLNDKLLLKGEFIRNKGSQIKRGQLAVSKDILITPAVIGFLSALGLDRINVYAKPKIYLIITGNEIQQPGKKLKRGKVYDSNSYILEAALKQMDLKAEKIYFLKDDKRKLKKTLNECLEKADAVLISGGVSVGKYDFVNEVLSEIGSEKLFYKVSQRPGKPLYFGKKEGVYIFGLPGNPASVLTCFYEYVYPLLRKLQGHQKYFLPEKKLASAKDIHKNFKLGNFLKGKITPSGAEPLEGQASYIISSFTNADCFIYLPLATNDVKSGEEVEVHLLPTI